MLYNLRQKLCLDLQLPENSIDKLFVVVDTFRSRASVAPSTWAVAKQIVTMIESD